MSSSDDNNNNNTNEENNIYNNDAVAPQEEEVNGKHESPNQATSLIEEDATSYTSNSSSTDYDDDDENEIIRRRGNYVFVGNFNEEDEEGEDENEDVDDNNDEDEEDTNEIEIQVVYDEDDGNDYDTVERPSTSEQRRGGGGGEVGDDNNNNNNIIDEETHDYLGTNFFEEVNTPNKLIHEQNDRIQIPLLHMPGLHTSVYNESEDVTSRENNVQLLPGQVMPIYFYSPLQIQVIKKRMKDADPTVGFALCPRHVRKCLMDNRSDSDQEKAKKVNEKENLGILAEIISVNREIDAEAIMNDTNNINNPWDSIVSSGIGLVIKVKGRERFEIVDVKKEITGCILANVLILPDYVFRVNPLKRYAPQMTHSFFDDQYLGMNSNNNNVISALVANSKAEHLNQTQPFAAWIYRKYDCAYIIHLIRRELNETFGHEFGSISSSSASPSTDPSTNEKQEQKDDPLIFSLWLLNNFPFDNMTRIECLRMNCVNHRLMFMHGLLRSYANIHCQRCDTILCSKSDTFTLNKSSYMNAYLNPGGVTHETLTVYKLKNFSIMREPPSLQHTWFPGYGWQICSCKTCHNHIGWKFTAMKTLKSGLTTLSPLKFFGLTRKSIRYSCNTKSSFKTPEEEDKADS